MNELTKEYALKALDRRIGELEEYIRWKRDTYEEFGHALKTGQNVKDGLVEIDVEPSFGAKIAQEAYDKMQVAKGNYEKYKAAREDLAKNY